MIDNIKLTVKYQLFTYYKPYPNMSVDLCFVITNNEHSTFEYIIKGLINKIIHPLNEKWRQYLNTDLKRKITVCKIDRSAEFEVINAIEYTNFLDIVRDHKGSPLYIQNGSTDSKSFILLEVKYIPNTLRDSNAILLNDY